MDLWELRTVIFARFAEQGVAPTRGEIEQLSGGVAPARRLLGELHERHLLMLGDSGEIAMALPFAAAETGHRVRSGDRSWWANCAWDALAIPIALRLDAEIDATWLDTGEAVELEVRSGELSSAVGFIHFAVPARRWWDDIGET